MVGIFILLVFAAFFIPIMFRFGETQSRSSVVRGLPEVYSEEEKKRTRRELTMPFPENILGVLKKIHQGAGAYYLFEGHEGDYIYDGDMGNCCWVLSTRHIGARYKLSLKSDGKVQNYHPIYKGRYF